LKFRVGGFAGKVIERMGGVPQNIPGGEIYQALEKGTIDAAEWIGPYDDQKLGFNKVAPFYYYPGWWEGGPQLDLYINDKAFNALSAENKAIVECAAAFAHVECQAKYDARNPIALKQLVAGKTKVLPFPKDVMDIGFKESMALYDELSTKNPNWKKCTKTIRLSVAIKTCGSGLPKPRLTVTCKASNSNFLLPPTSNLLWFTKDV
jgi:TRAP-type mannitol/chloroaromatic compound transport system substrate-binding protein